MIEVRDLPYPPIWVNKYIEQELKKYDFNVILVPSNPSAIDDIYKNTLGSYPDLAIQYDRLFRDRKSTRLNSSHSSVSRMPSSA